MRIKHAGTHLVGGSAGRSTTPSVAAEGLQKKDGGVTGGGNADGLIARAHELIIESSAINDGMENGENADDGRPSFPENVERGRDGTFTGTRLAASPPSFSTASSGDGSVPKSQIG